MVAGVRKRIKCGLSVMDLVDKAYGRRNEKQILKGNRDLVLIRQ